MPLMVGVNVELPAEEGAYPEFARNLPVPDIYYAIKVATPLSLIYRYQRTANQMQLYCALKRMLESFILVGDAVSAFNPVFGQGMSVNGLGALVLDQELRSGNDAGLSLRFQKGVAKVIAGPWQLATSEDARNPKPGENVGIGTRLLKVYMDHLFSLAATDL